MTFNTDGLTTVDVLYNSALPGSGSSWIAIPRNLTQTTVAALKGTITSMARQPYRIDGDQTAHPFYDNLTFSYNSYDTPFSMQILFNMTNGAMIVEPNGFFYSPQIGVPTTTKVEARLILPDGVEALNQAQPRPTRVQRTGSHLELLFNPDSESRIAVTFTVSWPRRTEHIQEGIVGADVPTRYSDLGRRMVALYREAVPLMNDLFNETVDRVSMNFFTPLSLPQLSIGGYTPIDPTTFQTGSISLNLFYFRALSGTMETIAIHELTHQYEARAGISPDLLWVQEGLANYVAVQMGGPLGYETTSTDADLETVANELRGNFGMIQYWQSGTTATSLYLYYAASYEVLKTLGDQYGGLSMYKRFFRGLHELKDGLRSTSVAVLQLGRAAKTDLFPQFKEWGFELVDMWNIGARIAKLRTEARWYGPLLPFREQALNHLEQAESSMERAPEVAMGHVSIAAFYIETIPMIIGGFLLLLIIAAGIALLIRRRTRKKSTAFGYQGVY